MEAIDKITVKALEVIAMKEMATVGTGDGDRESSGCNDNSYRIHKIADKTMTTIEGSRSERDEDWWQKRIGGISARGDNEQR